ncbi:helix-turn-helix domain-containing protein [Candidatus Thiothrix sp. Deng01]|uniref:Helix-turn-helix domain-containing protein n=1 Tax=Candidatus Thiothrix phosphatis TaxID=3112415 RepID=A0ABU6CWR1_9GAMM|nr:helix-turn-helix domain-containing protein [Candidatus Thiothrix sp. Deng01]MEB4590523.1 helix-turn-helix domain-containing protein [Candidatus Thiothrix sp. Deng01]
MSKTTNIENWDKKALTVSDMTALFSVSRATIYRWSAAGFLPKPRKIGGSTRWLGSEVAAKYPEMLAGQAAA